MNHKNKVNQQTLRIPFVDLKREANFFLEELKGLDKLFALKNRSDEQPVSLGVFSLEQAEGLVIVSDFAKSLLDDFPIGSITLILDAKEKLDSRLGGKKVAIRVFSNPVAILKEGRLVKINKCKDSWCKVETNNYKGWIQKDSLWGLL